MVSTAAICQELGSKPLVVNNAPAVLLIRQDARQSDIRVRGCIDASVASAFAEALARDVKTLNAGGDTILLDFEDLELDDGVSIAQMVNALRELGRDARVVVRRAPQLLAHTLYKAGMLRDERLTLEDPRQEEGFAG